MKVLLTTFLVIISNVLAWSQSYKMPVYGVVSNGYQPGAEANKCIDDDVSTMYHSRWGENAIPDKVVFAFTSEVKSINKIVYTPRQTGTNGMWRKIHVSYSTQDNPEQMIRIISDLTWDKNASEKIINLNTDILNPSRIQIDVIQAEENNSSCAEMAFYSRESLGSNVNCNIDISSLVSSDVKDVKVSVVSNGTTASSFQPGAGIELSYDNDVNTMYHSKWSVNDLPITINYRFSGKDTVDYMKYIARKAGSNGKIGKFSIKYNTSSSSILQTLTNGDFYEEGNGFLYFPKKIVPLNIQIIVSSGYDNLVSIAEMEFYKTVRTEESIPSNIFSTNLCDELVPSITQQRINSISSTFFRNLAQCIFDEKYKKSKRVRTYEAIENAVYVNARLKTEGTSLYENPTGVFFNKGEKIVLFADANVLNSAIKIKDFENSFDAGEESLYPLKPGLNVFVAKNKGLVYVNHYLKEGSVVQATKINIVSGKINDFYQKNKSSSSDWMNMLNDKEYPMVDILTDRVQLMTMKSELQKHYPLDPTPLLEHYDEIVYFQDMLQGLYKYGKTIKNRKFAYAGLESGFYATNWGINLSLGWDSNSGTVLSVKDLSLWGVAHEFGHTNQIKPMMKYPGLIEVTNNIYSSYTILNSTKTPSLTTRLEEDKTQAVPNNSSVGLVKGGIFNKNIIRTSILNETYFTATRDPFDLLIPFYQLMLYYNMAGAAKGAPTLTFSNKMNTTHTNGVDYANWHGIMYEKFRTNSSYSSESGELMLLMIEYICDAVKEDLTDYFVKQGMLKPIDIEISEYYTKQFTLTQNRIDQTIQKIKNKGYAKPASPVINYINAHSINTFKNRAALTGNTGTGYSLSDGSYIVSSDEWKNVVAYEVVDANGSLVSVSLTGTDDISNKTSKVYFPNGAKGIYAVGYNGDKIPVFLDGVIVNVEVILEKLD